MTTEPVTLSTSAECIHLDDRRRPHRPSPYFRNGAPTRCAHCAGPFQITAGMLSCWHGRAGYYCSEICTAAARPHKDAA